MQLSRKRLVRHAAVVAALPIFAFFLRFVFHPMEKSTLSGIMLMTLRSAIHLTLTVYRCASVSKRILNTAIRRMLISVGILLIFWQVTRTIKYDYVIVTDAMARYLWYSFYIAMILVPLIGFFLIDHIGKPEGYRSPRWMKYLFIPAGLLIRMVFTNDLHQKVFSFNENFDSFNSDYGYGFLYPPVMLWFVFLGLYFVGMLLKKSRVTGSRAIQRLPLFVMLGAIVFWTGYSTKWYFGDMTAVNCLIIVLLLESAIQSGLIPSNRNYDERFRRSAISVVILDAQSRMRYSSGGAGHAEQTLIEKAKLGPVERGDSVFDIERIKGGYVFWQTDVGEIKKLADRLLEANELLKERYDLKKAEVKLRERSLGAEKKSRLYDRMIGLPAMWRRSLNARMS